MDFWMNDTFEALTVLLRNDTGPLEPDDIFTVAVKGAAALCAVLTASKNSERKTEKNKREYIYIYKCA